MTQQAEKTVVDFDGHYASIVNGAVVTSPTTAPVFNPAIRQVMVKVPVTTRAQLDEAVAAARGRAPPRLVEPAGQRAAGDREPMGDLMEAHAEEFMTLLTREQGKPRAGAEWEVYDSIAWFREIAKQSLPDETILDSLERTVIIRYTPIGVVGAIVAWNFPTPLCDLKMVELFQELVPPGVLSAVAPAWARPTLCARRRSPPVPSAWPCPGSRFRWPTCPTSPPLPRRAPLVSR